MANRVLLEKASKKRFDSDGNELIRALVYETGIRKSTGGVRAIKSWQWIRKPKGIVG